MRPLTVSNEFKCKLIKGCDMPFIEYLDDSDFECDDFDDYTVNSYQAIIHISKIRVIYEEPRLKIEFMAGDGFLFGYQEVDYKFIPGSSLSYQFNEVEGDFTDLKSNNVMGSTTEDLGPKFNHIDILDINFDRKTQPVNFVHVDHTQVAYSPRYERSRRLICIREFPIHDNVFEISNIDMGMKIMLR